MLEIRVKGAIGVIELKDVIDLEWMQAMFVSLGVWVRPFRNLIYIMPAYIIQREELSKLTSAILTGLEKYIEDKI